jgi:hypothetical protein
VLRPNEGSILFIAITILPRVRKKLAFDEYPIILAELHIVNVLTNLLNGVVGVPLNVLAFLGVIPTIVSHDTEFNGRNT